MASVKLTWTKTSEDVVGAVIERSHISDSEGFVPIATEPDQDFIDDDVDIGNSYWYRVKCYDAARNFSQYSNVVNINI